MFDSLCFPPSRRDDDALAARLRAPIAIGPADRCRHLGLGRTRHLNRTRPCGWHLVVHRGRDAACWTHLYRVVPEAGGTVLVLLCEALEGDHGDAPERFSRWPLPEAAQGCKAGGKPGKDA